MKKIQIKGDFGHLIDGVHRDAKDGPISVVDVVADQLLQLGHAELVASGLEAKVSAVNPYADAVSPLVPAADPMHAARAQSKVLEEHVGLVALAAASPEVADTPGVRRLATPKPRLAKVDPAAVTGGGDPPAKPDATAPSPAPAMTPTAAVPGPAPSPTPTPTPTPTVAAPVTKAP